MNRAIFSGLSFGVVVLVIGWFVIDKKSEISCAVQTFNDVEQLFVTSSNQINPRVEQAKRAAQQRVSELLAVTPNQRTFINTAQAYDDVYRLLRQVQVPLEFIKEVSPDQAIRDTATSAIIELTKFTQDILTKNKAVVEAFKAYADGNARTEKLSDEQCYYVQEMMRLFKREGLDLPDTQLDKVRQVFNDITQLTLQFDKNISDDATKVLCTEAELDGVPQAIMATLSRDEHGRYLVGLDYPTVGGVLKHACIEQTRKKVYEAFANRAYPANYTVLEQLVAKRSELARLLGFDSFAAYDLDGEMVHTPAVVEQFLADVRGKLLIKQAQEFNDLLRDLPAQVTLKFGKFKPWDGAYVRELYKQKHLQLDDNELTKYFPVGHVIDEIFAIYQNFLGLRFERITNVHLWHDSVYAIAVYGIDDNQLRGYLLLDLYPRPNKYSHACMCDIISAQMIDNQRCPAVIAIIANFPPGSASNPGLLKFSDVEVFFHEFGHAMHGMVGATQIYAFSGTSTKVDFVEMPSQMFEHWVQEPVVLKRLSHHYQTGQPLPDATINTLSTINRFDAGYTHVAQIGKSLYSLRLFGPEKPDIHELYKALMSAVAADYVLWDDAVHTPASFGHLTDYGAKYYSYLWSKVFAIDVFDTIKQRGGLIPTVGQRLVADLLGKGGAVEPSVLLERFLGRAPTPRAFFDSLGI